MKLRSPDTPWPSIAGLRNIVVHEYFRVDHDLIARIVQEELFPLVETIRQLRVQRSSESRAALT